MDSSRNSLSKIGEPKPGKSIPSIPSGFWSFPKRLKAGIHAMNPPLIESWSNIKTEEHDNEVWTEECQGLTTDGQNWFVVSNNQMLDFRAIHKFTFNFDPIANTEFPEHSSDYNDPDELHIGSPDYHSGKIYVPIESARKPNRVWVLDTNLVQQGIYSIQANNDHLQAGMPWCAINPWDGHLYSSKWTMYIFTTF